MSLSFSPLVGVRFYAFENIHTRLAHTHSSYWDSVYSRALDALLNERWQPTGPLEKVVRSAIANAKKTVSRRASRTVAWQNAEAEVPSADRASHADACLDFSGLLSHAPGRDRAVLELRLAGEDDEEIARQLGVLSRQVPVLHHRAVKRLRQTFRRTD